jgi:hypothetical protein
VCGDEVVNSPRAVRGIVPKSGAVTVGPNLYPDIASSRNDSSSGTVMKTTRATYPSEAKGAI